MQSSSIRPSRRGKDFSEDLYAMGWYHSFELPDGTTQVEVQYLFADGGVIALEAQSR